MTYKFLIFKGKLTDEQLMIMIYVWLKDGFEIEIVGEKSNILLHK